jgi:ferritin-like protein
MANEKNLKPFKKGQSGNPKGRPKMPNLKDAIAKILAEEKDGMQALEAVIKALRAKAVKGDVRAAKELLDRAYGTPKQTLDLSGELKSINITIDGGVNI